MRVLYFASQFSFQSGASHAMLRLATTVRDGGDWTMVVAPVSEAQRLEIERGDLVVVPMPLRALRGMRALTANLAFIASFIPHVFRLAGIIRRFRIDIVHVNEVADLVGVAAALVANRPCVMHVRADLDPRLVSAAVLRLSRPVSRLIGGLLGAVVVPSESVRSGISPVLPGLARRATILNDVAFDVSMFHPGVERGPVRDELGIPPETPMVLLASKLAIVKGHAVFLDAAVRVAAEEPAVLFADVGDVMTDHVAEAEEIRSRAREVAGKADVRMLGYRQDLPRVMAACDVFVHCPTYADPFPTVVPEAMMMGKAVIGSRIGGIPEQIVDGETGLLVGPSDSASLAQAILRLVRDADLRKRLGEAALLEARARYVPERQAEAQVELYRSVLRRGGR